MGINCMSFHVISMTGIQLYISKSTKLYNRKSIVPSVTLKKKKVVHILSILDITESIDVYIRLYK